MGSFKSISSPHYFKSNLHYGTIQAKGLPHQDQSRRQNPQRVQTLQERGWRLRYGPRVSGQTTNIILQRKCFRFEQCQKIIGGVRESAGPIYGRKWGGNRGSERCKGNRADGEGKELDRGSKVVFTGGVVSKKWWICFDIMLWVWNRGFSVIELNWWWVIYMKVFKRVGERMGELWTWWNLYYKSI